MGRRVSYPEGLGFEPMDTSVSESPEVTPVKVPATHLVASIVVAALLFLPTGLIAILFAWRTHVWNTRADFVRARVHSRLALAFVIVTVLLGVVVYVAIIGGLLALGAFGGGG